MSALHEEWNDMLTPNSVDFYTSSVHPALAKFGLPDSAAVTLIKHRENAVYKVETSETKAVLRMHRPGYRSAAELWSEAQWTEALATAGVDTPHHIIGADGDVIQHITSCHSDQPILCDLLGWVDGREPAGDELESTFVEVGRLSALIHSHSVNWEKPSGFVRPILDETRLFGRHGVWGDFNELQPLTAERRKLLNRLAIQVHSDLSGLGKTDANWGLIHGDLMPENILQTSNGTVVIDFDDGGFGWFVSDLATSLGAYLGTDAFDTLMDAWIKGYATVSDPSPIGLKALPTFIGARLLQGLGWMHSRAGTETANEMTDYLIGAGCAFADDYLSAA
jgi:Ser/Thr protein kinase RdoA (MazF antagonist)